MPLRQFVIDMRNTLVPGSDVTIADLTDEVVELFTNRFSDCIDLLDPGSELRDSDQYGVIYVKASQAVEAKMRDAAQVIVSTHNLAAVRNVKRLAMSV